MYKTIEQELTAGHQLYVICPRISDAEDIRSVEAEVNRLKPYFRKWRIGKLHGKLSPEEKHGVMRSFVTHELDILVSTTVVEVGVDVPNATVMIIENADTFGLAQLHQLRGRVGRSEHQSYCYLVPSSSAKPSQRLRELEKSGDGFYLAERDLELRGPGEIYGRAQHGALNLSVARLSDTRLLKQVRDAAQWMMASELNLVQYKRLLSEVERYRRLTTLN
jgi:ATP-dependent DNA helicase RecG